MKKKQTHHIAGNLTSRKKQYNYPGELIIDGNIEPGCQVSADTIEVNNVDQANVRVRSGICVREKVTDSDIVSGGYVESKRIERSSIHAENDVTVQEIIQQSDIFTNSCCLIANGIVEQSNVMACRCIDAHTIISSEDKPCTLTIGLLCPDNQDQKLRSEYLALEHQKKKLHEMLKEIEQIIDETFQLKEKIKSIKPSLKEKISKLKKEKNFEAIKALDPFFKQLEERIECAFNNYQAAIEGKKEVDQQIESFDQDALDTARKEYLLRKKDRVERSKQCHISLLPYIQVRDNISEHTRIQGLHAYQRLQESFKDVRIEEIKIEDIDQTRSIDRYEMSITQSGKK